ncbi:FAD-dependent oxidoreductase, partial [Clostridium sp. HBUAS56017]
INRAKNLKNLITFTNTTASVELVENLKPDVIINATGSKPLLPPITGLLDRIDKQEKIQSIFGLIKNVEMFKNLDLKGKKIAVVGGGAVGLDVVEFFTEKDAEVTIIERLPVLGRDLDIVTKVQMMTMVEENKVNVMTDTSLLEVKDNSFKVNRDGKDQEIEFDYGFVCLGMRSETPILASLQEKFADTGVEVINIGDSLRARRIIDGTQEGRYTTINVLEKLNLI